MKNKKYRSIVQGFFFILIALISTNHVLVEKGLGLSFIPSASLHALCPFGGVVTAYNLVTAGIYVQKIHQSAVVLLAIVLFLSILFGAVFCGWICPFGSFQEWLGRLGKAILKKKYNHFIPEKLDQYLRYLRYLVLIWVIYVTAVSGKLIFNTYDPYHALFTFWSGEVAAEAIVILFATMLLTLFVERPWCKYACPYGAFLGITNLFRIFKINRQEKSCISCKRCDRECPMSISISDTKTVKSSQCISCLNCTSEVSCPAADTVRFEATKRREQA